MFEKRNSSNAGCSFFNLTFFIPINCAVVSSQPLQLGVNAKNEEITGCWWLKNYDTKNNLSDNDPKLMDLITKINTYIESKGTNVFTTSYGQCYINPMNNTIFILMKENNPSTTSLANSLLKPDGSIHVIYKTCRYTYNELESYVQELSSLPSDLNAEGVNIVGIGISENATIVINMTEVTTASVSTLLEKIPVNIPRDSLVIRRGEYTQACAQTDRIRPVLAGIKAQCWWDATHTNTGTLAFYGTDALGNRGILTVAHLYNPNYSNKNIYQPTIATNNLIGLPYLRCPGNMGMSDSAFIKLNSGVTGVKQIYPQVGGATYFVRYVSSYSQIAYGTTIRFAGQTSGFISGPVYYKGGLTETLPDGTQWYLFQQIGVTVTCQSGDSGAPAYWQGYNGDNTYSCTAAGILNSKDTSGHTFFSPMDGVNTDLGCTFNITG